MAVKVIFLLIIFTQGNIKFWNIANKHTNPKCLLMSELLNLEFGKNSTIVCSSDKIPIGEVKEYLL